MLKRAFSRPFRDIIINGIAASVFANSWLRRTIYKLYGMKINKSVIIKPGCTFTSNNIEIGDSTWINYYCNFNNSENIKIGCHCDIAFNVTFICGTHKIGTQERRAGYGFSLPIIIEDGCWIGANTAILPGVTIGEGCVIGAGAVVTSSCEPNGLYVGVPAKRVKDLNIV